MELIKKLGIRDNNTNHRFAWGLFICPLCNNKVGKYITNGLIAKSCGCRKSNHGEKGTRLYCIWGGMKARCLNLNSPDYKHYGGRGIKVCDEWLGYVNFRDWSLSNGYSDELGIDRIDNNGNYEPNNCRWVTVTINNRNKRTAIFNVDEVIELRKICKFGGVTQVRIAKAYNIGVAHLSDIVRNKIWKTDEVDNGRIV